MKKSNKPSCFGTQSCGTEEYDGCEFADECSEVYDIKEDGER